MRVRGAPDDHNLAGDAATWVQVGGGIPDLDGTTWSPYRPTFRRSPDSTALTAASAAGAADLEPWAAPVADPGQRIGRGLEVPLAPQVLLAGAVGIVSLARRTFDRIR